LSFSLAFNFPKFAFSEFHSFLRFAVPSRLRELAAFPRKKSLNLLKILGWREITRAVSHMIFKTIGLLIALVAVRFGATERLGKQE